jgi:hypothetical protein
MADGPAVWHDLAVQLQVRCRCNVMRTIDTGQVGPWRLRCKQCGDVLYDPRAQAAEVPLALEIPREEPASDEGSVQDSEFQRRLMESAELKVMMSADPDQAERCRRHPKRPVVAACTRCAALLCKRCLDKIGDEFVCAECVADVASARPQGDERGVMAWFKKLFGAR